jgi:hypothetical protein
MRSNGDSEGERMISKARMANVLDHVERACRIEEIGRIIVVTNSRDMAKALAAYPVILEMAPDLSSVPFGEELASVIERHGIESLVYVGGGSAVFMNIEDLARMARSALAFPAVPLVNSFYSTDIVAFGKPSELTRLRRCQRDNQLGWVLGREERLKIRVLPSSLGTRFDIDTPVDLMILKTYPPNGRHLAAVVSSLPIDPSPLFGVMDVLVDRGRQCAVLGRIPLEAALSFDRGSACHLRLYVEERGMETQERAGGIWSLAGQCMETLGISGFFQTLSRHAHAAIIDSRVLFNHLNLHPTRQDRFFSDLRKPDAIQNETVRRFTQEACKSSIPVVLGGHTLVSGGLLALAESAWRRTREPVDRGIEEAEDSGWGEHQRIGSSPPYGAKGV